MPFSKGARRSGRPTLPISNRGSVAAAGGFPPRNEGTKPRLFYEDKRKYCILSSRNIFPIFLVARIEPVLYRNGECAFS